ncbi:hypothetical protein EYF80_024927 [Liparis tanakae]|uniref:Uncharacterized protein n=1 Tax=Liparis tanakae TaxID=230148 RepID=A0A4Z2HGH9_9TELE|nr:hypothetical protein EYF80_024927 [Liparis tanakae]
MNEEEEPEEGEGGEGGGGGRNSRREEVGGGGGGGERKEQEEELVLGVTDPHSGWWCILFLTVFTAVIELLWTIQQIFSQLHFEAQWEVNKKSPLASRILEGFNQFFKADIET